MNVPLRQSRSLIPSYIRDSAIAVICYDITDRASFLNVPQWIEDVRVEREQDVVMCLVGNKTDLSDLRKVSVEEGQAMAEKAGIMFIETSAKAGYVMESQLFEQIMYHVQGIICVLNNPLWKRILCIYWQNQRGYHDLPYHV